MAEVGILVQNPIPTCDNHPSDEVEVYCKDCAKAVCFNCSRNHHRDHDCEGISRLSRQLRQKIPETCKEIRDGTINKMNSDLIFIQSTKQANKENFEQKRSANDLLQDQIIQEVKKIFKRDTEKESEKLNKQNEALNVREQELMKDIDELQAHVQNHQDSQLTYGKWEIIEMDEKLRRMTIRYGSFNTMGMMCASSTPRHLTTKQKESLEKCIQSFIPELPGGVSSDMKLVPMAAESKSKYPTSVLSPAKYKDKYDEQTLAPSYGIPSIYIMPSSRTKMPVYFISMITTSSDRNSSLLQLSVLTPFGKRNWYVEPSKPISTKVEECTGIRYFRGKMYVSGRLLKFFPSRQVLQGLLDFLGEEPAYLIGHNIKRHGCYAIIEEATPIGLNERFARQLTHMVDIVDLARHHYKGLKTQLTLEELSELILGKNIVRNDAAEDVTALNQMFEELYPSEETLEDCMFDYEYVINVEIILNEKSRHLKSWQPLIRKGAIPKKIAKNAARNGIDVWYLYSAYLEDGEDKLTSIMCEIDDTNQPKVSNKKEHIHQLCCYFNKLKKS